MATTEELFPDATKELERSFDLWDDQGFWLAFLVLPIILLSFRKGNIAVILLAPILFSDPASALGWQDLWKTADQQASDALQSGDAATAQTLFKDPQWRGSAAYKAGDYESAISDYLDYEDADSHYNRGNALAHSGDLDAAIEAYDQALALNPDMEDAGANKMLLEQLKQQQEQEQQNSEDSAEDSENSENSEESEQNQDSQSQDSQSQDSQPQDSESQESESQESDPQDSQQQNPSEQESEATEGESEESEEQQREREEQEAQEQEQNAPDLTKEPTEEESEAEKQAQQELEQWLRRVPDDPGGLLREKFRYQSRQRALEPRRPVPPNNEQQERW